MNAKLIKLPKIRLRIGLDCDDVLFECVSIAIALANKQRAKQGKPPLKFEDVIGYGVTGTETDEILPFFSKAELFESQTVVCRTAMLLLFTAKGKSPRLSVRLLSAIFLRRIRWRRSLP